MATFPVSDYPGAFDSDIPVPVDGQPITSDWGKGVRNAIVATQTELGADPSGSFATVAARFADIESDVAAIPAPDASVFYVQSYGGVVNGVTDDTAAWQAAINAAAAAGGGVVTTRTPGVSVIGGALQDTSGANAQLLLPDVHALNSKQIAVEIRGPFEQSSCVSVVGAALTPTSGLVLKSTLASGSGAVIGAYGSGTSYQHFTFLHLTLRNLTVRTVANPTISGLDLRRVNSCTLQGVIVDTGQYDTALTQPTTATSFGLRLPTLNNGAHVRATSTHVYGFYNGWEFSEHGEFDGISVGGCRVALTATAANHSSRIGRVLVGYCMTGLKFTGAHYLEVDQYAVEHAASGWYVTTNDVDDASNFGKGRIAWAAVLQGVGPHNVFTKSGGSGITTARVGDVVSGGGTGDYTYRDRLVASAGNNTLTLGATPVANSPLVWVNGAIKWPSTDYAITGSTVSFVAALSASDVVAVQYRSTASTASASALSTAVVGITDTFNRADSSSSMGSTSVGSAPWTAHVGTWGISSNKAYVVSGAGVNRVTADAALADCTVSAVVSGSTSNMGLVFRANSTGLNGYIVEILLDGAYTTRIYRLDAGATTTIATGSSVTVAAGSVLSVVLSGNSITVKDDGVTILSATDSTYATQTRHGFYLYAPSGTVVARFDDFAATA